LPLAHRGGSFERKEKKNGIACAAKNPGKQEGWLERRSTPDLSKAEPRLGARSTARKLKDEGGGDTRGRRRKRRASQSGVSWLFLKTDTK